MRYGPRVSSAYQEISYESHGHVRVIRIERPGRMNAIGPRTSRELVDAWGRFKDDDEARVAILTGSGDRAFCAGADLRAALGMFDPTVDEEPLINLSPDEIEAHNRGERDGIIGPSRWTDIYKPIIAAVNGVAYAGGLEWACFADIRIADEHASFGVTCRRWNVGLGDGGTQRLPRIVGMGRAMELIITGRVIGAGEAERIGLVNEVVPSGTCLERALEMAAQIAELPQPAMRTDKEAAIRGFGQSLDEGLRIEAECFNRLIATPGITEGVRRFVERDHPDREPSGGNLTPGLVRDDIALRSRAIAIDAHHGQVRKDGASPYTGHVLEVADLVDQAGLEPWLVAAAALHDLVEKTGTTSSELRDAVGDKVTDLVLILTEDPAIESYVDRKHALREQVSAGGRPAQCIYAADKISNIRELIGLMDSSDLDPDKIYPIALQVRIDLWDGDLEMLQNGEADSSLIAKFEDALGKIRASGTAH